MLLIVVTDNKEREQDMKKQTTDSIRNSKGFTLLELMVLVAIIGILAGLATSYLNNPRLRLRAAARDVVSKVQHARFKALETGDTWAVQFDTSSTAPSYRILSNIGPDNKWNTADDEENGIVYLDDYPGISFGSGHGTAPRDYGETDISDGMSAYENRFIFNADGTTGYPDNGNQKSQGVVYMKTKKGETFAVGMISAAGMIKTWRNYASGWEE
ncbi:Prepilin-type cleavage/methylation domain-containing protein [Desulfonema limicola]|uniref:Prepilin-type cleavage/methylation domain-containing protein n=2 Tax=Desulfonema limicola TaxID=45656 RepID=A0A975GJQ3_9BACT|nr:Prepilin-type cleavage/methylation domain-containing protein [Desulfonema limicola]